MNSVVWAWISKDVAIFLIVSIVKIRSSAEIDYWGVSKLLIRLFKGLPGRVAYSSGD